jgi:hypothetical protein
LNFSDIIRLMRDPIFTDVDDSFPQVFEHPSVVHKQILVILNAYSIGNLFSSVKNFKLVVDYALIIQFYE